MHAPHTPVPLHRAVSILMLGVAMVLSSCVSAPDGVTPVTGFDVKRYEGRWYEIARLDHPFERGLTNVTATYSESPDGGVLVLNRGYDPKSRKWKTADGLAKPLGDPGTGSFKVKVSSPFYASYHVIALDQKAYGYALVSGPTRDYLWILSRTPQMKPATLGELKAKAAALGFPTGELIMVSHDPVPESGGQ
ncbi:apolipoprotein D and lipocalin family protein [Roseimicrobium gellanilyticum]|uniref:Apolipoprotein D and lipocalin family protein n=1 Tax=Roseimicrobium gellanilyticum TaxID=748857 RepID=A0A366HMZ4_9BACT|nr:lipocalin family protein [Roseimicrobium gellanilyticum]RBP44542.1 apolipoprotein D and lipocalin family protein [Roseimicrobium gellanilyticum]